MFGDGGGGVRGGGCALAAGGMTSGKGYRVLDESPVEPLGLGCFLRLPAWFLRLGKNLAIGRWALAVAVLVVLELLDLAEWREPPVPDRLQKQARLACRWLDLLGRLAVLCCAVLCYAMLCCAMLCYAMLCYAMLCYAMLWHGLGMPYPCCPAS